MDSWRRVIAGQKPARIAGRSTGFRVRLAGVVASLGFLVLWPLYGELYRHGGDKAVEWTDLTPLTTDASFSRPDTRIFASEAEVGRYLSSLATSVQIASATPRRYVLTTVGPRSSTGYRLRVVRLSEERGRILIRLREDTPRREETVAPRVTSPFLLLALPAGDKPVRVELEGRP